MTRARLSVMTGAYGVCGVCFARAVLHQTPVLPGVEDRSKGDLFWLSKCPLSARNSDLSLRKRRQRVRRVEFQLPHTLTANSVQIMHGTCNSWKASRSSPANMNDIDPVVGIWGVKSQESGYLKFDYPFRVLHTTNWLWRIRNQTFLAASVKFLPHFHGRNSVKWTWNRWCYRSSKGKNWWFEEFPTADNEK